MARGIIVACRTVSSTSWQRKRRCNILSAACGRDTGSEQLFDRPSASAKFNQEIRTDKICVKNFFEIMTLVSQIAAPAIGQRFSS